MSWLVLILVYGLGYPITAVITVTINTSVTGYCPNLEVLRYRHQNKLALINNVAITPYGKYVRGEFVFLTTLRFRNEIYSPQLFRASQMESIQRISRVCCIPHKTILNVHFQMD